MKPFTKQRAIIAILETLHHCGGYALETHVLQQHVSDLIKPPIADDVWSELINELVDKHLIVAVDHDLDDTLVQYALTGKGKAVLASNQS
jgi:hypothetical protein